jgi:hypothetical protein
VALRRDARRGDLTAGQVCLGGVGGGLPPRFSGMKTHGGRPGMLSDGKVDGVRCGSQAFSGFFAILILTVLPVPMSNKRSA